MFLLISFSIFSIFLLADTLNLIVILIWNDTTHVQILFINWLRVVGVVRFFVCSFAYLLNMLYESPGGDQVDGLPPASSISISGSKRTLSFF